MIANPELAKRSSAAFTLLEVSVVLVIIGLIVGGVLVGKDLIAAASLRSQITQIEKYNTAANTFRLKYGGLPGDLKNAQQFGFTPRGPYAGQGDGNGVIEGLAANSPNNNYGCRVMSGELAVFFRDMAEAGLVEGNYPNASVDYFGSNDTDTSKITERFPKAAIGNSNFIYPWSGGAGSSVSAPRDGSNYFALAQPTGNLYDGRIRAQAGLTVLQASQIDAKVDDGLSQNGKVKAWFIDNWETLWASGMAWGPGHPGAAPGVAAAASAITCYDNGNSGSNTMQYSVSYNGGRELNCAVSFQFR